MAELKKRFALGLDFGTESVRALAVDCTNGDEVATEIVRYPHGVITEWMPWSSDRLPPDFALQSAEDYLNSCVQAIQGVLRKFKAEEIIGIGVDFTACTILPIKRDGTPLMNLPEFRSNPHAWVKLWKHHAAQPEADRVNELARERKEPFMAYYSGAISSEWMLPKCWEIAKKAPEVYEAADLIIDAGDWVVHQLTGVMSRNSTAAGYKGMWNAEMGFPSQDFLKALDPRLSGLRDKWLQNIVAPGSRVGGVSEAFSEISGLRAGTPVSAATIDAHSGVAGMGVFREGPMAIIMGTSSCHMALSRELHLFDGYAGVVKDGIVPGFYGYESGQSAVGDIFGWFANHFLGHARGGFEELSSRAAELKPGESGLIALDWMNGNRSVLMDADLSGAILGMTLHTKPEEVYRTLIEATAFGTKIIIDRHVLGGLSVEELVVCGGLIKDPLIMQIYADVTHRPVRVATSGQAVALGSAVFGALAAGRASGGFDDIEDAICTMTRPAETTYQPNPENFAAYDELFEVYQDVHDWLGRDNKNVMKKLKNLKINAKGSL